MPFTDDSGPLGPATDYDLGAAAKVLISYINSTTNHALAGDALDAVSKFEASSKELGEGLQRRHM